MANAMDWLGVGSACSPAQDADDDDDDPRRRPRGRDASPETPHSAIRRGALRGLHEHHDGMSSEEESDGPNRARSGRDGKSEYASSEEYSDYTRGLSYSESEGEGGARFNGQGAASKWRSAGQTLGAVATLKSSLKSPSAVKREQKKATFALMKDEERHVLDDPEHEGASRGQQRGKLVGGGSGQRGCGQGLARRTSLRRRRRHLTIRVVHRVLGRVHDGAALCDHIPAAVRGCLRPGRTPTCPRARCRRRSLRFC
jgi:hypothetical protein